MAIGLSPQFQKGKCDICGKKTDVRVLFDSEKKKTAFLCAPCAESSKESAGELLDKYGKKGRMKWTPPMVDKEHFTGAEFEVKTGLKGG